MCFENFYNNHAVSNCVNFGYFRFDPCLNRFIHKIDKFKSMHIEEWNKKVIQYKNNNKPP